MRNSRNPADVPVKISAVVLVVYLMTRKRDSAVGADVIGVVSQFEPLNTRPLLEYTGPLEAVDCVALFELPDLSAHVVTFDPDKVTVDESVASSHIAQLEISVGRKVVMEERVTLPPNHFHAR
jgi:hypothetical protein